MEVMFQTKSRKYFNFLPKNLYIRFGDVASGMMSRGHRVGHHISAYYQWDPKARDGNQCAVPPLTERPSIEGTA